MWSWLFIVTVLLYCTRQAESQGKMHYSTVYSPNQTVRVAWLFLCAHHVFHHFAGKCNNVQAADIVFLVDGSSSIGRINFLQVKGFMAGIVKPFASAVSESGIRFGAIQYSETSR